MRRLLVLRPEPGASSTLARAKTLGLEAIAVPLFEIEPIAWNTPDASAFDGLLLTSANTIRHGGAQIGELSALPVYAVGQATSEAARDVGLTIAATGDSGVDALLNSIDRDLRLLHLCGEDRRNPSGARQHVTSLPIYRAKIIKADLGGVDDAVALIHSPRAGERFAKLVHDRSAIAVVAISAAAAEAVGGGWQTVEATEQPTDEALLALAARLCNNSPPK
jgi:uroporphyrinogen-III synthase